MMQRFVMRSSGKAGGLVDATFFDSEIWTPAEMIPWINKPSRGAVHSLTLLPKMLISWSLIPRCYSIFVKLVEIRATDDSRNGGKDVETTRFQKGQPSLRARRQRQTPVALIHRYQQIERVTSDSINNMDEKLLHFLVMINVPKSTPPLGGVTLNGWIKYGLNLRYEDNIGIFSDMLDSMREGPVAENAFRALLVDPHSTCSQVQTSYVDQDEYINNTIFDDFHKVSAREVGSPNARTRFSSSHLICFFCKPPLLSYHIDSKESKPRHHDLGIPHAAEIEPFTVHNYRNRPQHLQALDYRGAWITCDYLLALLKVNFYKADSEEHSKTCNIKKRELPAESINELDESSVDNSLIEALDMSREQVEEKVDGNLNEKSTKKSIEKSAEDMDEEEAPTPDGESFLQQIGRSERVKSLLPMLQVFGQFIITRSLIREPDVLRIYLDLLS
ncbi:hypothetical protein QAD02_018132 [Eretmocerus hayati]|uniref:Uncharacterized protein n=1 Tax=Eretmocerus hayati TaxID=131215 RepID=A0ACC2PFY5_9HYME|nr:hypothetical protein QAD02_018132 [Eretmocerus hayati]